MNTLNLELFLHTLVMLVLSMGAPPDVQWVATTPLDTRATWTMACNELVFLLNLWLLLQPRVRHSLQLLSRHGHAPSLHHHPYLCPT